MSPQPHSYRSIATAACFGTFLEWYDFLTFGSLATTFGLLFFPSDDPVAGLLASLATFGIGMVIRPVGAALFGSIGDRKGRRFAFIATIALMGGATFSVGLLPTHAQVGIAAPLLLVAVRILQGLAMGGEIGGAIVYLTEHAPPAKRGFYTSVLQLMGPLGVMVSTFQITLLQAYLSHDEFLAWGWRVPFIVSILLLAVSIKSRMALHESPVFLELRAKKKLSAAPLRDCLRDPFTRKRMIILFCCISAGGSLLFFSSQVYTGVFLKTAMGMDPVLAGRLMLIATLALFPLTIICGRLSDRIGRRPVLLSGLLLGAVGLLPIFAGLRQFAAEPVLVVALLLVPILALALITGPQTAAVAELFPARSRYSAVAFPHNLAAGWIGGMSPFVVTWIGRELGDPLDGMIYPVTLLAIGALIAWRFLPETRGRDLND